MIINITYPHVQKKSQSRRKLLQIIKWPFLTLGFASIIVNICVGGKIWSPIAVVGLWMIWKLVFNLDLVEYNRISQFIKATAYSCIIIFLIHILITPIWALGVISTLIFASLIVSGILFLTDIKRQKQNMLPMFFLNVLALIGGSISFTLTDSSDQWTVIVLCSISFVLLIVCIVILRTDFIRELKKGFHIK